VLGGDRSLFLIKFKIFVTPYAARLAFEIIVYLIVTVAIETRCFAVCDLIVAIPAVEVTIVVIFCFVGGTAHKAFFRIGIWRIIHFVAVITAVFSVIHVCYALVGTAIQTHTSAVTTSFAKNIAADSYP